MIFRDCVNAVENLRNGSQATLSASTYMDSSIDSKTPLQSFLSFFSVLPRPPIQQAYIHTHAHPETASTAPFTTMGLTKSVYYIEASKSRLTYIHTYIHTTMMYTSKHMHICIYNHARTVRTFTSIFVSYIHTVHTYIHLHTYIYCRRELRAEERAEAARLDAAMAKLSLEAEQERIERVMKLVRNIEHTYIHTYIQSHLCKVYIYVIHTYCLIFLHRGGKICSNNSGLMKWTPMWTPVAAKPTLQLRVASIIRACEGIVGMDTLIHTYTYCIFILHTYIHT